MKLYSTVGLTMLLWQLAPVAFAQTMPTFFDRRDYDNLFTQTLAVADVNGDGIPDIIAGDGGFYYVLLGNGDGTYRTGPSSHTIASFAYDLIAQDVNGDGIVDLVMGGWIGYSGTFPGGVIVCLGNGDGTFAAGTFYPDGMDSYDQVVNEVIGDFNGDGILDIAQAGPSGIWLFTGIGDGTFNSGLLAVSTALGCSALAVADFNEDGKLDLVLGMTYAQPSPNGFFVYLGNGNGTFQSPQHYTSASSPLWIATGKLGANGKPGIAISNDSEIYVYLGDGKGQFSKPRIVNAPALHSALAIGDLNGDGIGDIASATVNGYVSVAYGTASGEFETPIQLPFQNENNVYDLVLADLRNIGRLDILTDSQTGISVLLNESKGLFEDGLWTNLGVPAGCGVTGDFNGDGKPDIAVNTAQGITILLGTGRPLAPLEVGQSIPLAGAGCLTTTGDVNGDHILDLVISTLSSGVLTYLGNGDGTFTLKGTTATPSGSNYLVLGDFNHDGKLDFATAGNELAYGNGDGTFQTPQPFTASPPEGGFANIAVGDINNDGWPDLVLPILNLPVSDVYVLLNNHKGSFVQVPQTFGWGTNQAVLADLNGDGNLDLLLDSYVYLGNGKGDFTFQFALGVQAFGFDMPSAVADINGDGIPDILLLGGGSIQINLGTGNAQYATPFFIGTRPSPASLFVSDLHGQTSESGFYDLVTPDQTGGVLVLINQTK